MIDVKDIFQHIADDNQLHDRPANTPDNIFFQCQFFPIADQNSDQHQHHRQRQRFVRNVMPVHAVPPAYFRRQVAA